MQSQMHAFVEKVSVLRSESLRVGLLASLRAAKTIEKTEFADFIESPDTALWKLAVVSMLVNDGLIVFSTTEGDSDAEHIQSDISVQRLEQLRASCGEQEQEDASSEFERQLEQLGMEGQGCGFGKYTNTVAQSVCASCWDNSGHDDTYTGCLCNVGYTAGDGDSCEACGNFTFKDEQSNALCRICRDHSESMRGAVNANDCKCVAGRFLNGDVCEPCAAGSFKEDVGNEICTECEATFSTRDTGSTNIALCVCPPGHYKEVFCEECPENYIKPSFSDEACTPCRANSKRPAGAPADAQARCECDPGFHESTGPGGELACAICPAGTFSAAPGSAACSLCEVNTFSCTGSAGCEDCGDFSSTHGESGRVECQCVVGYARVDGPECEVCAAGKFKQDYTEVHCAQCQVCASGEQVLHACSPEHSIVCGTCMASSSTLGLERTEEGLCNCDVGFELVGGACAQCVAGSFKDNTNNSKPCEPCASFTFAPSQGASVCGPCRADCAGEAVRSYVSAECPVAADISCSACSVCGPGRYNNPLCGPGHASNRQDSVCTLCEPGTFCPGDGGRVQCTHNSSSAEGSVEVLACVCLPGFYKAAGACVLCPLNDYCYDNLQHDCPLHSHTLQKGSESVADCICRDGYYRSVTLDVVVGELCTVNDFCFDKDRIDCHDDLMTSPHGSSVASNCTCVPGYYNNEDDTECLPCGIDTYCVDGVQNICGVDEWTQGESLSEQCWCRPGTYPDENGWCVQCSNTQFCEGDGTASACPTNSTSSGPAATDISSCLCDPGFGFSGPPARCIECGGGTVKLLVGNEACVACAQCGHSRFVFAVCIPHTDTVCDACRGCLMDETYTSSPCMETQDAVCSDCVQCVADMEYEHSECEDGENRVCLLIEKSSDVCEVGQYRGGHTATGDSDCLPCEYLALKFEGQTLHVAGSRGQRYNDAQSCNVTCLGNSMHVDMNNQTLGCVSCETGNVLLKVFDPLSDSCHFECRAGYTRVTMADGSEDCYDPVLHSSVVNDFSHNFSVTDFSRTGDASVFRILHQDVGFFMIVVGRHPPANCRYSCCFEDLWLVSSLHMMGLEEWQTECRPRATLAHVAVGSVLTFMITDAILEDVAQCEWSGASRDCMMQISLIDMHTFRVSSRSLSVRTTHSMSYIFSSNELQYIPLEHFDVDLVLAHLLPGGDRIFQLHTRARGPAMSMHLRIPNMQLVALVDLPACDRLLFGDATQLSESSIIALTPGQQLSVVSYWRAAADVETVKALYTLLAGSGHAVVMDVGAVRNVLALVAQCTPPVVSVEYQAGAVRVAFGMGRNEIHRMTPVPPEAPTRGELGTLVTFLVQKTRAVNASLSFSAVLAAYGNSPGTIAEMDGQWASTMVARSNDARRSRDFTPGFKTWCLQRPAECQYEYIRNGTKHNNLHILFSCAVDAKREARQWLGTSFGVAHDGGHVDALCDSMVENAAYAPAAVMVNTMKFLYRGNRLWNIYQNFSALDTKTFLWTDFSILS